MSQNLPTVNRVQTIRDLLNQSREQLALALPRHLTVDRMLRVAMTSIQTNYKLLECDPKSLLAAVMESAQLGLEPTGILGYAYLVPYKVKGTPKAQLQIGYRGFLDLARRSGQVTSFYAHVVHEKDSWQFQYGLDLKLTHTPTPDENPGKLIAAYAVIHLKDGGLDMEWLWKREIEQIRKSSKASDSGPWQTHYEEMAKKTAIRRLAKRVPLSINFQQAAVVDEYAEAGVMPEVVDPTGEDSTPEDKTKQKAAALKERLAGPPPPATPQPEPSPTPQPPPTEPKEEPRGKREPELLTQIKHARPGTSPKNLQLFRERVLARIDEIRQWPEEFQKQVAQKWTKTYPGEDFWEQVNGPSEEPEEPQEPQEAQAEEKTPASPELMAKVQNAVQNGYEMSAGEAEDYIWTRLGDNPSDREARQIMAEALNEDEG